MGKAKIESERKQAAEEKAIAEAKLIADKKVESCSSKDPDAADIERLFLSKKLHYQKEINDSENELNEEVNDGNGDPQIMDDEPSGYPSEKVKPTRQQDISTIA